MNLKHKFFSVALASMICMGGFFASCEDDCADCDCNMVLTDVISPTDATESPLSVVKFDNAIILRGENLGNANRVVLVDEKDNEIALELKPAFVTNRAVIVKLDDIQVEKTVAIRIYSRSCGANYAEIKIDGYPAPVINGFYNEFTPDGGELRIAGNYYYGDVKVTFDLTNGEKKEVDVNSNTSKVINVTVGRCC